MMVYFVLTKTYLHNVRIVAEMMSQRTPKNDVFFGYEPLRWAQLTDVWPLERWWFLYNSHSRSIGHRVIDAQNRSQGVCFHKSSQAFLRGQPTFLSACRIASASATSSFNKICNKNRDDVFFSKPCFWTESGHITARLLRFDYTPQPQSRRTMWATDPSNQSGPIRTTPSLKQPKQPTQTQNNQYPFGHT